MIINGDCLEELKKLEDNSIDCIITDPPYNVLALDWDKQEIDWDKLSKELFRVLKDYGSVYIFGQTPFIFEVYKQMINSKFDFRQDLVWMKNRGFSLTTTTYTKFHENILYFIKDDREKWERFGKYVKEQRLGLKISLREVGNLCEQKWYHRGGYQFFETGRKQSVSRPEYDKLKEVLRLDDRFDKELFNNHLFNFEDIKLDGKPYKMNRKKPKLYGKDSNMAENFEVINEGKRNPKTILEYSIIQSGKEYVGHPTQKPIELLKYLLTASSNEGDVILDPFAGSFSTLVACQQLNRKGIGIELSEEYCEMGRKRLQQKSLNDAKQGDLE